MIIRINNLIVICQFHITPYYSETEKGNDGNT